MRVALSIFIIVLICSCSIQDERADQNIIDGFSLSENNILLLVRVADVTSTGFYDDDDSCPAEVCVQFKVWYRYHAEVLEVLEGNYSSDKVTFSFYQHAPFIKEITDEWYVQLSEYTNPVVVDQLKTKYYVSKHNAKYFQK